MPLQRVPAAEAGIAGQLQRLLRDLDGIAGDDEFQQPAIGATAGIMVAPVLFLDPNMMGGVLLYAFTGALLGGITSPVGAVVGGLIVGVTENLVGTYLIASQLKLTVALALIILVLVFRPNGLFGTAIVRRV